MATKSNGTKIGRTDLFKGLVSWLCMLFSFCALPVIIISLIVVLFNPDISQQMGRIMLQANTVSREEFLGIATWVLCAILLCTAVLLPIFLFRRDRMMLTDMIARGLSKIWVEIKLVLIILGVAATFSFLGSSFESSAFAISLIVLITYFLCLDIGRNRRFFSHNVIRSLLHRLNDYKNLPSFERRTLRRLYSCLGVIAGVLVFCLLILLWISRDDYWYYYNGFISRIMLPGVLIFSAVAIIGTVAWYVLSLKQDMRDWNELMAQIAEMYGGNLDAVNHVSPTSNLYLCAMQLNMIRTGIQKAVDEGIRADRTKVELITNVSHDIKTPLTSIISYVELLKKEPDLPPHVMDYVNTISAKADRLSHIVQDVFDISKAATGNISLELEDLDIGKLLQQTFAEMGEVVESSSLTWRLNIPEAPVLVHADGQRLYRVFQNLIRNCIQYSLEGSRAYVTLSAQEGIARVTVRNISKNEITMNGEDLTARFVRGDQNRTTEGSGLGLSIAKSFTEACGGKFSVHTEEDLFTVSVSFPQVIKAEKPVSAPVLSEGAVVPAPQTATVADTVPAPAPQDQIEVPVSADSSPVPPESAAPAPQNQSAG